MPGTDRSNQVTTQVHSEDINKLGNTIQQFEADKKELMNEKANLEAKLWESTRKLETEKTRYQDMLVQVRAEEKQNYEEVSAVLRWNTYRNCLD